METHDIIVIGQGYAGLTAARRAIESGHSTVNIESNCMGGLILNLNELHPTPAGQDGGGAEISSNIAMANMEAGVVNVMDAVTGIEPGVTGLWQVHTEEETYQARHIVVASGARLRKLGVPGEEKYFGRGVSECADCDGPLYSGMDAVVVGGGDSAFQEALTLAMYADKVTIVLRGDVPRAGAEWQRQVAENSKIELLKNTRVTEILSTDGMVVTGVTVQTEGQAARELPCGGVFVFIGLDPNTEFLPPSIERDAAGAILVDNTLAAGANGLWAIGAARSGFGGALDDADADSEKVIGAIRSALASAS